MDIVEHYITNNENYQSNVKITVEGIVVHSVGVAQPDPQVFVKIFNVPRPNGVQVGVHGFVGREPVCYQTLPWNHKGWHCGGTANNTHIGIEMTEPATLTYGVNTATSSYPVVNQSMGIIDINPTETKAFLTAVYRNMVALSAMLCTQYNLDPLKPGVIISHAEGYQLGRCSNHADPAHLWRYMGFSMDQFRAEVATHMHMNANPPVTPPEPSPKDRPSSWATTPWAWAIQAGITDGTRPKDIPTREELVTMLYRYHNH